MGDKPYALNLLAGSPVEQEDPLVAADGPRGVLFLAEAPVLHCGHGLGSGDTAMLFRT